MGRKLIRVDATTPANDHDFNVLIDLLDPIQPGQPLYADAAYQAEEAERALRARRIHSRVAFKRSKGSTAPRFKSVCRTFYPTYRWRTYIDS